MNSKEQNTTTIKDECTEYCKTLMPVSYETQDVFDDLSKLVYRLFRTSPDFCKFYELLRKLETDNPSKPDISESLLRYIEGRKSLLHSIKSMFVNEVLKKKSEKENI